MKLAYSWFNLLFLMTVGLCCLCASQTVPQEGDGFAVAPLIVTIVAEPNTVATGEFRLVTTTGARQSTYAIELHDLRQNADGTTVTERIGGGVRSCAPWIRIDPAVTLGSGERKVIPFSITVPADVEGAYYSLISVRRMPNNVQGNMVLPVTMAIAIRVELQIQGSGDLHVDVSDISVLSGTKGDHPQAVLTAANTGVWAATAEGDILFYGPGGTFPVRIPLPYQNTGEPWKIYPGAEIKLKCPITEPLPPGDYKVVSRLLMNDQWPSRGEFALTVGREGSMGRWSGALQQKEEHDLALWVDPDIVELSIPAGASRMVPVKIHNRDNRGAHIELSVSGFKIETNGFYTFPADPDTASGWVTIVPETLNIPPGQMRMVQARIVIPKDRKEYETVVRAIRLRATTLEENDGWRSGTDQSILVVASGPKAKSVHLELSEPELVRPYADRNPSTTIFRIKNVGEKVGRFRGILTLERTSGQDLLTVDVGKSAAELILPGCEREFRLKIPPLDKDSFRVRADFFTLGDEQTQQFSEKVFKSETEIPDGL